jgi:hypothetical protein
MSTGTSWIMVPDPAEINPITRLSGMTNGTVFFGGLRSL